MSAYWIEIQTYRPECDGFTYVQRDLTDCEVAHITAHIADPESPISAIVRLPEMTEAT